MSPRNFRLLLAIATIPIAVIFFGMIFFIMPRLGSDVAKVGDAINKSVMETSKSSAEESRQPSVGARGRPDDITLAAGRGGDSPQPNLEPCCAPGNITPARGPGGDRIENNGNSNVNVIGKDNRVSTDAINIQSQDASAKFQDRLAPDSEINSEPVDTSTPKSAPKCPPNCSSTNLPLQKTPLQKTIDSVCPVCAQLFTASAAFNRPTRMNYGRATQIEFVIAPNSSKNDPVAALSKSLSGEVKRIDILSGSLTMQVQLSGKDFDVQPTGPQEKTVLPDRTTPWTWQVTPNSFGEGLPLVLEVSSILEVDGKKLPPGASAVYTEVIPVDVSIWNRLVLAASGVTAVNGAIVGVGGTLIGVALWIWNRIKKPQPPVDNQQV